MAELLAYEEQSELVKALWESDQACALTNQAARRIEELEKQLRAIIDAHSNNSGYEPSLSVFQREITISKELLDK